MFVTVQTGSLYLFVCLPIVTASVVCVTSFPSFPIFNEFSELFVKNISGGLLKCSYPVVFSSLGNVHQIHLWRPSCHYWDHWERKCTFWVLISCNPVCPGKLWCVSSIFFSSMKSCCLGRPRKETQSNAFERQLWPVLALQTDLCFARGYFLGPLYHCSDCSLPLPCLLESSKNDPPLFWAFGISVKLVAANCEPPPN